MADRPSRVGAVAAAARAVASGGDRSGECEGIGRAGAIGQAVAAVAGSAAGGRRGGEVTLTEELNAIVPGSGAAR
jgi:hypothetical protein